MGGGGAVVLHGSFRRKAAAQKVNTFTDSTEALFTSQVVLELKLRPPPPPPRHPLSLSSLICITQLRRCTQNLGVRLDVDGTIHGFGFPLLKLE